MTSYDELIDVYMTSLYETDNARRRKLIEQVWEEDGVFVSTFGEARGHAAIDTKLQQVLEQFLDVKVYRTTPIEVLQNHYVRFGFEATHKGGEILIRGTDFGVLVDEKLHQIVGFSDTKSTSEKPM